PRLLANTLTLVAAAGARLGEHRVALLLAGAADAVRERESTARIWHDGGRALEALAATRQTLGPARARELDAEGRAMSVTEATALVGRLAADLPPSRTALTRRQLEVLELLAAGSTDQEIASALFLSRRTVSWHVSAILTHFQATTRSDAVARARSDGLA
ncbi:MAG: LuxR C-terminal-related transcriptional regulator, partial [Thermomicrobiales bacterium]